jgi:hypothetical protein
MPIKSAPEEVKQRGNSMKNNIPVINRPNSSQPSSYAKGNMHGNNTQFRVQESFKHEMPD